MEDDKLLALLAKYRSGRNQNVDKGESSMTTDFRICETVQSTPCSVTTSTAENQSTSQSTAGTCCPPDSVDKQPKAKQSKPESSCKPPLHPHQSVKVDGPANPTPLKVANVSDFSTPARFRRVPLRNLSSSSHDSSSTTSSIQSVSLSCIKTSSRAPLESKDKENSRSELPELQQVTSQLEETKRSLKVCQENNSELRKENDCIMVQLESTRKSLKECQERNSELRKENQYIVGQIKMLQEKASIAAIEGGADQLSQIGHKVIISGQHYNVQRDPPIGKGASCRVYSGVDCATNSQIAIKVVNLHKLPDTAVQVLEKEIELLQDLRDECYIINVLNKEMRLNKGQLLIVLEFGETDLNSYLKKQLPLCQCQNLTSYFSVMSMWHQMLAAVQSIHKHNIIHKDLKPQNFLLVKGELKLIDFGISEMISADVTSMVINQPEGTPNYIAPELLGATFGCAASNRLGYCSDVYSLGCILYKMCFGVTPYQYIDKMQMKYYAITSPDPIKIPALPHADLVQIMTVCLAKDRQKRPTIQQLMNYKGGNNF